MTERQIKTETDREWRWTERQREKESQNVAGCCVLLYDLFSV